MSESQKHICKHDLRGEVDLRVKVRSAIASTILKVKLTCE